MSSFRHLIPKLALHENPRLRRKIQKIARVSPVEQQKIVDAMHRMILASPLGMSRHGGAAKRSQRCVKIQTISVRKDPKDIMSSSELLVGGRDSFIHSYFLVNAPFATLLLGHPAVYYYPGLKLLSEVSFQRCQNDTPSMEVMMQAKQRRKACVLSSWV